ncbi:unnamed protein product [Nesidiocoris tenuis]|uniref:Uncharacterized protein n=1 Tax=Nesidiocoris tenuis TaxID=355587 RepID=A0A6H5HCV7_9HEMI|nr:unnamed protein product [Nesidiocoris tenuis]
MWPKRKKCLVLWKHPVLREVQHHGVPMFAAGGHRSTRSDAAKPLILFSGTQISRNLVHGRNLNLRTNGSLVTSRTYRLSHLDTRLPTEDTIVQVPSTRSIHRHPICLPDEEAEENNALNSKPELSPFVNCSHPPGLQIQWKNCEHPEDAGEGLYREEEMRERFFKDQHSIPRPRDN